ncbi:MAG: PP2C family protein-serine/threonine phosphatase [Phycisphaerae bacterium]
MAFDPGEEDPLPRIAASWPDASAREGIVHHAERCSLDALLPLLTVAGAGDRFHGAIIVLGGQAHPARVEGVVASLREAGLAAVCLCQEPSRWRVRHQSGGILFEPRAFDAGLVAPMLFALVQRQSVVRSLRREVELTSRCEMAIREEMERMHDELQLAASVQREFIDMTSSVSPMLDHALISRPISFVSGDVSCLRDLGDDRVAFFLADAAGHGMPAALLTMVLVHALDTIGREPGLHTALEPMEVLARLNACICAHARNYGWFASATYGVLDCRTGEVLVANAGHPPPLVIGGPEGSPRRELSTQGPVLGIAHEAAFDQVACRLAPGESLLLYSDGLECVAADAPRGERSRELRERPHLKLLDDVERYASAIPAAARAAGEASALIVRRLGRMIDEAAGSLHQADDITVLVLGSRRAGGEARKAA